MGGTLTVGRVAGIPIGVHYTWLLAVGLIAVSLATGFFPTVYPGWEVATYWVVGIVAALTLFVSVLLHELSHSLLALARGLQVHGIVLFIFGGVSHIEEDAEFPRDEFLVAIVGPLTSFALAGGFWGALFFVGDAPLPIRATLAYLATINLFLGAFNLVPAFPLDGGRVLRSIVWAITHDVERSTRVASYIGQGFAMLLIGFGAWQLVQGNLLAGGWTIIIGWFLNDAALDGRRRAAAHEQPEPAPAFELEPEAPGPIATPVPGMIEVPAAARDKRLDRAA
jgi:Zn-dependent protease